MPSGRTKPRHACRSFVVADSTVTSVAAWALIELPGKTGHTAKVSRTGETATVTLACTIPVDPETTVELWQAEHYGPETDKVVDVPGLETLLTYPLYMRVTVPRGTPLPSTTKTRKMLAESLAVALKQQHEEFYTSMLTKQSLLNTGIDSIGDDLSHDEEEEDEEEDELPDDDLNDDELPDDYGEPDNGDEEDENDEEMSDPGSDIDDGLPYDVSRCPVN
jgi:hypothetical protein